jgi:exosortase D (VPLPA-CTERM-specific)
MATTFDTTPGRAYAAPVATWLWLGVAFIAAAVVARDGLALMVDHWLNRPEYSHGSLIPLIAVYLIWRRGDVEREPLGGSWVGPVVVLAGLGLWLAGTLSTIFALSQYALVLMIYGVVISLVGVRYFRKLWAPMLMLLLAIPLPGFFYNNLSFELQLASSALGVAMIRALGISVFLSGNVIDLGHFQMQVVEACDGLRYLFPLMTLGFIVAYFFRAPVWQRALIFLSSIPITIFMNSLRIAMIGVFAEYGNTSLAEGLLHELQGWVVFMISGTLLLAETWLLVRLFMRGAEWREVLGLDGAERGAPSPGPREQRRVPATLTTAAGVLAVAMLVSLTIPERAEATPERRWFVDFPMSVDGWQGRQGRIDDIYLAELKLDDYLMADYTNGADVVNVYSAYFQSQRQGQSMHSPRSCIPGGGWKITEFTQVAVKAGQGDAFPVNRALIELGDQRQLVYYWFKQSDRELTNEYGVKWYIFLDALTKQRSDGAMVRLITPIRIGEDVALADARLARFAAATRTELEPFLPD